MVLRKSLREENDGSGVILHSLIKKGLQKDKASDCHPMTIETLHIFS